MSEERVGVPNNHCDTGKHCAKSGCFSKEEIAGDEGWRKGVLYKRDHRDAEGARDLIKGYLNILQAEVTHSHHQTIKNRQGEYSHRKIP